MKVHNLQQLSLELTSTSSFADGFYEAFVVFVMGLVIRTCSELDRFNGKGALNISFVLSQTPQLALGGVPIYYRL